MSLKRIDPAFFRTPAPPIPWIVQGLVAQGALTLLAGVGGLGKSLLALSLASTVARGDSWHPGFPIKTNLPMVYVDAENGQDEMHRRAHMFGQFDGFFGFDGDMADRKHVIQLAEFLREPAFVVLDSFRALYPLVEEDQSKDVLPVLRELQLLARETMSGILVLHHTTKSGATFRGSGEFQNRPEITVTMKRDTKGNRYLDWEKCRLGPEPDRKYFRFTNGSWQDGPEIPLGTGTYEDWE